MGLISRIRQPQAWTATMVDERVAEHFGLGPTASGITIGSDAALRISTYFACVRFIAEDVAKSPLHLYRRLPNGDRERVFDHPAARAVRRPNGFQTGYRFKETAQAHLCHRGNAFAFVNRYRNEVRELIPIHPDRVTVKQDDSYRVTYEVDGKKYERPEILHVPGLSLNGFSGVSVAKYARETLGLAAVTEAHGAKLFSSGALFRGILRHPGKLKDAAVAKRIRTSFDEAREGHGTALVEEGMEYLQMSMTAEDSQFLGTREFQAVEIAARWFRFPPHKLGIRSGEKYNSMEAASLEYVGDTLLPWFIRWEEEANNTLLTAAERDEFFFEHLIDNALRADIKTRYEAYRTAITTGFMSRNQARRMENWNAEPGLDVFLEPSNNNTPVGASMEAGE